MTPLPLLLVHWDQLEAIEIASPIRLAGVPVLIEFEDGARAWKLAKDRPLLGVAIGLGRKPSHGIETARAIVQGRTTSHLPLLVFDVASETHRRRLVEMAPGIHFVAVEDLLPLAQRLQRGEGLPPASPPAGPPPTP